MNLGDIFKQLKLDTWYKFVLLVSVALIFVSLTVDVKVLSNTQLFLVSTSGFCFALGLWKSERHEIAILNSWGTQKQFMVRKWELDALGCLFAIIGFVLIVLFAINLLTSSVSTPTVTTIPAQLTPTVTATSAQLTITPTVTATPAQLTPTVTP